MLASRTHESADADNKMKKAALSFLALAATLGALSTPVFAQQGPRPFDSAAHAGQRDVYVDGAIKPRARQMTHWGEEASHYIANGDDRFPH